MFLGESVKRETREGMMTACRTILRRSVTPVVLLALLISALATLEVVAERLSTLEASSVTSNTR
jgi:hypothetical protein